MDRRKFLAGSAAAAAAMWRGPCGLPDAFATQTAPRSGRTLTLGAKPAPISIDTTKTAVLVIDMTNDFGSKGGMFDRAGIDISIIQQAVPPTAKVLESSRTSGIKIVYLKMAYRPNLSDMGPVDSPNWRVHHGNRVGAVVRAPDGAESRIAIRDTWNTKVIDALKPQAGDIEIYKTRFSGFYQTDLDKTLKRLGARYLIVTGCTTSVCVESTIRDATFRDYSPILLADCSAEPIGNGLPRSNHEASLLTIGKCLGWVSSSQEYVQALEGTEKGAPPSKNSTGTPKAGARRDEIFSHQ